MAQRLLTERLGSAAASAAPVGASPTGSGARGKLSGKDSEQRTGERVLSTKLRAKLEKLVLTPGTADVKTLTSNLEMDQEPRYPGCHSDTTQSTTARTVGAGGQWHARSFISLEAACAFRLCLSRVGRPWCRKTHKEKGEGQGELVSVMLVSAALS